MKPWDGHHLQRVIVERSSDGRQRTLTEQMPRNRHKSDFQVPPSFLQLIKEWKGLGYRTAASAFEVSKQQIQKGLDGRDPLTFDRLLIGMSNLDPKWREHLASSGRLREALRLANAPICESLRPYIPDSYYEIKKVDIPVLQ